MTRAVAGGGSSAATWAVHAQCDRFRGTDSLITGITRRKLAADLGHPDTSARIPAARWTRAMIFERLCHDPGFAGEVTARATGWSGFERPTDVVAVDCSESVPKTLSALVSARDRAASGSATLLYKLAFPFPGFESDDATLVKPDLAVVARGLEGPTLIVGDAKDYERVRSRIDDGRLLKGFLQVAMGAFAFEKWSGRPDGITLGRHGFLAVPKSAFLQPTVEVEDLRDHLEEIREQWAARTETPEPEEGEEVGVFVEHLRMTFDPTTCPSCSLHGFCRSELRRSSDPHDLLRELGVRPVEWPAVSPALDGLPAPDADPLTVARVRATVEGRVQRTEARRLDPVGEVGTVNVVVVKADSSALGYHGIATSRHTPTGRTEWRYTVFDDPQSDRTRRQVMAKIGDEIEKAMRDNRLAADHDDDLVAPVHVVVPDSPTADLLASTADQLAGVELSRLRWARDVEMGRPILTWDGEPATMPTALEGPRRTAASFLLEHDRARMLRVRQPVVNLTDVMRRHFVPGGPAVNAFRLDYLTRWACAQEPVNHRQVTDEVEAEWHTPGARLSNRASDAITEGMNAGSADYERRVTEALTFRTEVFDRAVTALADVAPSGLRDAYRSFEGDSQAVWRKRMWLRASDLVRFGRTYAHWRNLLVEVIESDTTCLSQVTLLTDPLQAGASASDAGQRDVFWATVVDLQPLTLTVDSRRVVDGSSVTLIAVGERAWVDEPRVTVRPMRSAVRLQGFPKGPLEAVADEDVPSTFRWSPRTDPDLSVGDRVVLVDSGTFQDLSQPHSSFNLQRPKQDEQAAPKPGCTPDSYASDPEAHAWCCRPHEDYEAYVSDQIALKRARNELNPEVWPPVRNEDGFEVPAANRPTNRDVHVDMTEAPEEATTDDLE